MSTEAVYLVVGIAILLASVLPALLRRWAVSAPMVLLGVGLVVGFLPAPLGLNLDPLDVRPIIQRTAEFAVLIALMGVGIALNRPLRPRDRASWWTWSPTWRLLLVAMPITIASVALTGWALLGLAAPAALLLGAVLAPTDPVLAGDVQVAGPQVVEPDAQEAREFDDDEVDDSDEVRFALTSEAGLNDGLAFPFVYAAVFLGSLGAPAAWIGGWLAWEVVGKIVLGVVIGVVIGWGLARIAFRATAKPLRLAEQGEPLLALGALVLTYGVSELAGGYGFLAVFACGMAMRAAERTHEYHRTMHEVMEQLERLVTLLILLLLGMAMTRGLLADMDWRSVVLALAVILVVRPLAGWVALRVRARDADERGGLTRAESVAVAFFGVRGVGSIYYLAYAAGQHTFSEERWLWSTVALTIALSVVIHGVLATPVMRWLDRRRGQASAVA